MWTMLGNYLSLGYSTYLNNLFILGIYSVAHRRKNK